MPGMVATPPATARTSITRPGTCRMRSPQESDDGAQRAVPRMRFSWARSDAFGGIPPEPVSEAGSRPVHTCNG